MSNLLEKEGLMLIESSKDRSMLLLLICIPKIYLSFHKLFLLPIIDILGRETTDFNRPFR